MAKVLAKVVALVCVSSLFSTSMTSAVPLTTTKFNEVESGEEQSFLVDEPVVVFVSVSKSKSSSSSSTTKGKRHVNDVVPPPTLVEDGVDVLDPLELSRYVEQECGWSTIDEAGRDAYESCVLEILSQVPRRKIRLLHRVSSMSSPMTVREPQHQQDNSQSRVKRQARKPTREELLKRMAILRALALRLGPASDTGKRRVVTLSGAERQQLLATLRSAMGSNNSNNNVIGRNNQQQQRFQNGRFGGNDGNNDSDNDNDGGDNDGNNNTSNNNSNNSSNNSSSNTLNNNNDSDNDFDDEDDYEDD